jgi:hypothetical protein
MPARGKPVNLLPPSEFETSFGGKFLKWAVTGGRYIIIVTELIVILAFISRFKLDEDIRKLHEEIAGKVNVLDAELPGEMEFKRVQKRLEIAGKIFQTRYPLTADWKKVVSKVPTQVKLTSLVFGKTAVSLQANAASEQELGLILSGLSADPTWTGVILSQITEQPAEGIKFSVEIKK